MGEGPVSAAFDQPQDFLDESNALAALLEPLADADFDRATQFKSWTIHDVVAHLHIWNWAADLTLRDREGFQTFWKGITAGLARGKTLVDLTEDWLEGKHGRVVFDEWRAFYPRMAERYGAADPKHRVAWAGPDMSARSSVTARLMETWAHGQEIYDLLGVERTDTDRIKNIAVLGVNTFGWTFVNRKLEVPSPVPRVRLTAPSGDLWEWNAEVEGERVEGDATQFCQVVTQVRALGDTSLLVEGEVARRWMEIAQCFAGPVGEPPKPGERHIIR